MIDISCVIPIYHEGMYLRKTLRNLANQTFAPRMELILAEFNPDAGEISSVIVDRFRDEYDIPIKIVDVPEEGIGFARHTGIMASNGDVICNFDADATFSSPYGLQMMTEPLFKREAVLTHCDSKFDMSEFTEKEKRSLWYAEIFMGGLNSIQNVGFPVYECGSCIVKSVYNEVGGFMNIKQSELLNLAVRISPRYPYGFKHIDGVYCNVSPRRALKNAQAWKKMDFNAIFKSTDYRYAVRKDSGYKVE